MYYLSTKTFGYIIYHTHHQSPTQLLDQHVQSEQHQTAITGLRISIIPSQEATLPCPYPSSEVCPRETYCTSQLML
jgi:hypothetical protein